MKCRLASKPTCQTCAQLAMYADGATDMTKCDMGCIVDEADICPAHGAMCQQCCASSKRYMMEALPEFYNQIRNECPCTDGGPWPIMMRQKSQAHHFVHTHVSRLNEEMAVIMNMLRKPKAFPRLFVKTYRPYHRAGCSGI